MKPTRPIQIAMVSAGSLLGACLACSADALDHWEVRESGTAAYLWSVCYGDGLFVAVGDSGTVLTSSNGLDWIARTSGTDAPLLHITFASGAFVAVGGSNDTATILHSTNGFSWSQSSNNIQGVLRSVLYGSGGFVAVGDGSIATSLDGQSWSTVFAGQYSDVAYGNGTFVASGTGAVSPDGALWTLTPGLPEAGRRLAFGDGRFVACYGSVQTSHDGLQWHGPFDTHIDQGILKGITFANGQFVAVGGQVFDTRPSRWFLVLCTSQDGTNWTRRLEPDWGGPGYFSLHGITYGNGSFVAVGGFRPSLGSPGSLIFQSVSLTRGFVTARRVSSETGIELSLEGEIGRTYRLQGAPSVTGTNWADLYSFTPSSAVTNFVDAAATNFPQRFYRLISP